MKSKDTLLALEYVRNYGVKFIKENKGSVYELTEIAEPVFEFQCSDKRVAAKYKNTCEAEALRFFKAIKHYNLLCLVDVFTGEYSSGAEIDFFVNGVTHSYCVHFHNDTLETPCKPTTFVPCLKACVEALPYVVDELIAAFNE